MRQTHISHQFVEFIPERLDNGVLYISKRYGTAAHMCCCGCGEEVITPLNPTGWSLQISGNSLTLHPSIGNWSYACRSHYWIRKSKIIWSYQMTQQEIERGRAIDRATKKTYFEEVNREKSIHSQLSIDEASPQKDYAGLLDKIWRAIKRWCNS